MDVKPGYGTDFCVGFHDREPKFHGSPKRFIAEPNGENYECGLTISDVRLSDAGSWSCKLTQCKRLKNGGCSALDGNGITANATRRVRVCDFIF